MAITKNKQSNQTIFNMAKVAFSDKQILEIKELPEGTCNVIYNLVFEDGSESILKIASKDRKGNTSNEINLMQAEINAITLVKEHCSFKVPDILYYDTSKTICDGNYFFMEKMKGENFYFLLNDMPENIIATIDKEIGKISCELTKVQNAEFGFLGDDKRYESLFAFVKQMLKNLISDAKKRDIDILYDEQTLMTQLENDKPVFESIKNESLVHWDMWGEPFMDDRFRMHNRRELFLEGFGQTSFSEDELKRLRWYDIILYLTMMIEVFYREFDDKGQYFWAREMLTKTFE